MHERIRRKYDASRNRTIFRAFCRGADAHRGPSTRHIAIVVAILGGGVLFTAMTSDVTKISEPGIKLTADGQPFLPDKAGDWTGGELTGLTDEEKRILPEDTMGSRRMFKDKDGNELFCSIVLAGRDVTSIHRPELCLTGQGWALGNLQVEQIPTPAAKGGVLSVSRLNATRDVKLSDGRIGEGEFDFSLLVRGQGPGDSVSLAAHLLDGEGSCVAQHQPSLGLHFDSHTRDEKHGSRATPASRKMKR